MSKASKEQIFDAFKEVFGKDAPDPDGGNLVAFKYADNGTGVVRASYMGHERYLLKDIPLLRQWAERELFAAVQAEGSQ